MDKPKKAKWEFSYIKMGLTSITWLDFIQKECIHYKHIITLGRIDLTSHSSYYFKIFYPALHVNFHSDNAEPVISFKNMVSYFSQILLIESQ